MGYTNIEIGQEVTQGRKVMFSEPIEFEFIIKELVFRPQSSVTDKPEIATATATTTTFLCQLRTAMRTEILRDA